MAPIEVKATSSGHDAKGGALMLVEWPPVTGAKSYTLRISGDSNSKDCSNDLLSTQTVTSPRVSLDLASGAANICVSALDDSGAVIAQAQIAVPSVAPVAAATPALATALVFTVPPSASVVAGAAFPQAVATSVQDGKGGNVAAAGYTVTLAPMSDAACTIPAVGAAASVTGVTSAVGGATFAALAFTQAQTLYLKASAPGLTTACSAAVVVGAAAPDHLTLGAANGAPGFAGRTAAPTVVVQDKYGNPVPGTAVTFSVTAGGGTCGSCSAISGPDGVAAAAWTLGPAVGAGNSLVAQATGAASALHPVTISVTALDFYCDQAATSTRFQAGSGAAADPYVVCTAAQLAAIGADQTLWTKAFLLEGDLDLSAYDASTPAKTFPVIGLYDANAPGGAVPFAGVFDGNGHAVSHFKVAPSGGSLAVGFFSYANGATVKNLTLAAAQVTTTTSAASGILIGYAVNVTVSGSATSGALVQTVGARSGGLIGQLDSSGAGGQAQITSSSSSASVQGIDCVGGLIGITLVGSGGSTQLTNVSSTGNVTSNMSAGNTFGGFLGYVSVSGGTLAISHAMSSGSVTVPANGSWSGAFIGTLVASGATSNVTVSDSYETGDIHDVSDFFVARGAVGGFGGAVGVGSGATISIARCHATGNVHDTNVANNTGSIGSFFGYLSNDSSSAASFITVTDSDATGGVFLDGLSASGVGAFAGSITLSGAAPGTTILTRIFASGAVTGPVSDTAGGLAGQAAASVSFVASYWNSDAVAAGVGSLGSVGGASGESLANLKVQATYTGWDFTTVWALPAGGVPTLR